MPIEIKEAKTWLQRETFIKCPQEIYKDVPAYCTPVFAEQRKFISKSHPFREHGDAALFVAFQGKKAIGRAMVSFDPRQAVREAIPVGHVGLFECVNDSAAANLLLTQCETWAKEKHGVKKLRGPIDYSLNYPIGMYLGAPEAPQRILMNYHPPYYPKLWEGFGFEKSIDFFSWWGKTPDQIDRWVTKVRRLGEHTSVKIRTLTKKGFKADLLRAQPFISQMLEGNPGYVPMTDKEYRLFVKELAFVPPEMIMIAEDDGELVGLSLSLPDFNEAIRPINGKLFSFGLPIGSIKFFQGLKKIKTARMALLGVHPDRRFEGIAERMCIETLMTGREKFKFEALEIGWTFEDNVAMVNSIEKLGIDVRKLYRIYEKSTGAT